MANWPWRTGLGQNVIFPTKAPNNNLPLA